MTSGSAATLPAEVQLELWPYSAGSRLLDRDLAGRIRTWALTRMTEAELNNKSQGQLTGMYLREYIMPSLGVDPADTEFEDKELAGATTSVVTDSCWAQASPRRSRR
jgi:hypothetical protein